jgi:glycosyltransferase involved in cell wall biosynthesis
MDISVITPVYNGERFIESCLRSVVDQNCQNIEHLIIDGGSTDRTLGIVKQYADHHPHIRWISEKDKGQSDAMNKGLRFARGALVGFLNADDFYEPGALAAARQIFETLPEPSILIGNCNVIDDTGKLLWLNHPDTRYYQLLQAWRFKMPNNPSAYFYHRSLHEKIGEFDVNDHYMMDYDFLLKAFRASNVVYVDKTFGNYRMYADNKTSKVFTTDAGWEMLSRVSQKHTADHNALYRLHVRLGAALLRENLKNTQASFTFRARRRLMIVCQNVLDRVIAQVEKFNHGSSR